MVDILEMKKRLEGKDALALKALEGGFDTSPEENQIINKSTLLNKQDGRKNNKGIAGKAGRKPSIAKLAAKGVQRAIDKHRDEIISVPLVDRRTGKVRAVKMTRLMHSLMKLYNIGTSGEGSADAINKWMDRTLGRPAQIIKGDADEPIRLLIDF